MSDMPVPTEEFRTKLIDEATKSFLQDKENRLLHHRRFENNDRDTLNFIDPADMDLYEKSGGVTAIYIEDALHAEILNYFKKADHPITNKFDKYLFLYVEGGPYCVPHIDDASKRKNSFQLLLKSGGENTTTVYYEPMEQYKSFPVIDYCGIPYNKLDPQVRVCLKENNWYWMKTDSIHSVEGLQSLRIFLVASIAGLFDVKHLIK
jgi:hypothetical protein